MRRAVIGLAFGVVVVQAVVSRGVELGITVSAPFTISNRSSDPNLGAHIFPALYKMPCGDLNLVFNKDWDGDGAQRVVMKSSDQGKTWAPMSIGVNQYDAVGVLSDGTVLAYDGYAFIKEGNTSVGQVCVSQDGGRTFGPVELATFNRPDNVSSRVMAPGAAAPYSTTSAQWSDAINHALWRRVLERPDGTLIACAHTMYQGDSKIRTVCYQSTDGGMSWGSESTVAYDPNVATEGFVEPVMSFCSNGNLLCVMRTDGYQPLMQARSTDGGETWQSPTDTGSLGVDPDLCLMSNGVLACSYGRPGNRIMFSADGTGRQWTDRLQVYEGNSSGYTGIVEVAPGKLLMVYDRLDYGDIQGVFITVTVPEPSALGLLVTGLIGVLCWTWQKWQ